ncbi:ATP-binding protein [Thermaurantiacus sp.]
MHAPLRPRRPAAWLQRFRPSLGVRILLVNLVALVGLAIAALWLDSFRERLLAVRQAELVAQGQMLAQLIGTTPEQRDRALAFIERLSFRDGTRVRVYGASGAPVVDNWRSPATVRFTLEDPTTAGFRRWSAQAIDRFVDAVSWTATLPGWVEPPEDRAEAWPEARAALASGQPRASARRTDDRVIVLQAAVPAPAAQGGPLLLLLTSDTGDLVETVRQERETSFRLFLALLAASLLLSLYLARTIVKPLGELALAAGRVRRGREREVEIPRFPDRRDEIGRLARALSDMTSALRQRIDATEAFAADVAHELKNPLASLRSAVEALGSVTREEDRRKLFDLIAEDVRRIDRLVLDISAASRLEAELSRERPEPVDLAQLGRAMAEAMALAAPWKDRVRLAVEAPADGVAVVMADRRRLEQVIANLVENGASFSPEGGTLTLAVMRRGREVELAVEDEGPGVPEALREKVFERFYSERPEGEAYGRHSGLGLPIVRAIVEAFDGEVAVGPRRNGRRGASFRVRLPAAT